jgi:hypothetical protein
MVRRKDNRKPGINLAQVERDLKHDRQPPPPLPPRLTLNILEFCAAANISEGFFYKLKKQGLGPREAKIGTRTLITVAAANDWLRERERETAKQA